MAVIINGDTGIDKITDGSVVAADIGAGEVTQAKLASGVAGTGPAFSATSSANTSASSGVSTKLVLNTEQFDTNSNFDNATNYRFTPTVAGYYQINAILISPSNATATVADIYKNGSTYVSTVFYHPTTGVTQRFPISALIYLNGSTDYVELYGLQNGGTVLGAGSMMNGVLVKAV